MGDLFPGELGTQKLVISQLAEYKLTLKISAQSTDNVLNYPSH